MTSVQGENKLQRAYQSVGGTQAIPWVVILPLVLSLLDGCTPKDAKAFAAAHPVAAEFLVTRKLADSLSRKEASKVAKAAVKVLKTTTVAELESLHS